MRKIEIFSAEEESGTPEITLLTAVIITNDKVAN